MVKTRENIIIKINQVFIKFYVYKCLVIFLVKNSKKFIITRGLDSCLFGYSLQEWQKVESKIKSLPITKKNARTFQRFFFSGATEVEIDKQGRINIPNALIEHAFLDKECVVNGLSNRIEIWDKNRWEDLLVESEASVEEIAEELEDFDF